MKYSIITSMYLPFKYGLDFIPHWKEKFKNELLILTEIEKYERIIDKKGSKTIH